MTCGQLDAERGRSGIAYAPWGPRGVWMTLRCWRRRAAERRQLAAMPWERWDDISADPDAIRREIAKPFWRA
ncbi:hypothetical protein [Rhodovibrio salinarum]|uniref:DUF1127 domain-containing protein n=1 Tax=Rhodovibrio salinarum TaxID=1087 RepID=A0A934QK69_9PROT|nr:hypothetical protein [Rhodovibrio salinarum]MBK1698421.1 hypothetical protein [Rhodovibrio salinarum]